MMMLHAMSTKHEGMTIVAIKLSVHNQGYYPTSHLLMDSSEFSAASPQTLHSGCWRAACTPRNRRRRPM
jgi:hypothetical protein